MSEHPLYDAEMHRMTYTYRDLLKAVQSMQLNGDLWDVLSNPLVGTITAITPERVVITFVLEHYMESEITTILWSSGKYSDGVIVESKNQVISDLDAQITRLRKDIKGKEF